MESLKKEFYKLEDFSTKWEKYFDVYENIFRNYKNKKITFVEIGIFNGGSLKLWKNYFGPNSRIIGIDINKECKKFENKKNNIEVFIGNQSDEQFWDNFFNSVGKVDIILDDGGHTNLDQIITTTKVVDKINDGGLLVIEDTHTSYLSEYNSSKKFSFINFVKCMVDDLNSNIDLKTNIKKNFSLKKYIYSIEFFESIVVFKIDKSKTLKNLNISNLGKFHSITNLSNKGNEFLLKKKISFNESYFFFKLKRIKKIIKNYINNNYIKRFFK